MGISREARSPRAHVDSNVLRFVFDPAEDPDMKKRARKLFYPEGAKAQIWCSAPAAGEFLLTLARDTIAERRDGDFEAALHLFWEFIKEERLKIYMYGEATSEALALADKVRNKDPRITPTDAAIVGCFLSDGSAQVLYTTDVKVFASSDVRVLLRARSKKMHDLS